MDVKRRTVLLGVVSGVATASRSLFAQSDRQPLIGTKAGDERDVDAVRLCWCPAGRFVMGSPPSEPERRPGEDQVQVVLTKGFWMAKFETTQGLWRRVMGDLPGGLTAELPAGDDLPVGNVNFPEAEAFCRQLTIRARESGTLPSGWAFRLPTEAQWEYACRGGTTTATSFGDSLSSTQANFRGKPYNGGASGPSLNRAARVGSYPANAWGLHDMHGNTYEWCRDWYHRRLPGGIDPTCATRSARPPEANTATSPASAAEAAGPMTDGPAGRRSDCASSPNGATTTSAFASSPCRPDSASEPSCAAHRSGLSSAR